MSLFIRISTRIFDDPKVLEVGPNGLWLYLQGLCYAKENMTDGRIPKSALCRVRTGLKHSSSVVRALIESGLWEDHDEFWSVPADKWEKYQTTKAQVDQRREATKKRVAAHRSRRCNSVTHGGCNTPPEPEPEPEPYKAKTKTNTSTKLPTTASPLVDGVEQPKPPKTPASATRERNPMFDAVAEVTAADVKLKGSMIAKRAVELAKAGYTPQDVRDFGVVYAAMHPIQSVCSLTQLTAHVGVVRSERGLAILRNGGVAPQQASGFRNGNAPQREVELPIYRGDE